MPDTIIYVRCENPYCPENGFPVATRGFVETGRIFLVDDDATFCGHCGVEGEVSTS